MQLSVSVQGHENSSYGRCRFSPGDTVDGHVHLKTSEPLDITTISVALVGRQRGKIASPGSVDYSEVEASLLETTEELFRRDRYAGEPLLAAGTYSWPYSYTFPELPGEWDVQKLQSTFPASFTFFDDNRKTFCSTTYEIVAKANGGGIKEEAKAQLTFWPTRWTRLEHGLLPRPYQKGLHYTLPSHDPEKAKTWFSKRRPRSKGSVVIAARLHVPRLQIIGERLPLQIDLQLSHQEKPQLGESPPTCYVTSVGVELLGMTTVYNKERRPFSYTNKMQSEHYTDLAIKVPVSGIEGKESAPSHRVNLHDHFPEPGFLIYTQPWKNLNAVKMSRFEIRSTPGPIVPSFETPLCSRTYFLEVEVKVTCGGRTKAIGVKSEEVVLLPDKLDPKLGQSEERAQLDGTKDVGRQEVSGDGILELEATSKPHEAGTDGQGVFEIESKPVELPAWPATFPKRGSAPLRRLSV